MAQHAAGTAGVDGATGTLHGMSDERLLGRVAVQDVEAFGVLYDRHVATALALCRRTLRGGARADDACQEAFLSVWRSAGRFDASRGNGRTWLLTVVRNRAIDHLRRTGRAKDREVVDLAIAERHAAPAGDGTEVRALGNVADTETRELLGLLTPVQRQAVELSFYGGYTHVEIAARLGVPIGTVKARISRGLTVLRRSLVAQEPV